MQQLNIKRLRGNHQPAPRRETAGSAGYDLRATSFEVIKPGERLLIGTGFAWEIPEGLVGMVRPRSGLACRDGLHTLAGVIDSDYRGEVKVLLINLGDEEIVISKGDRIAQMVVTPFYGVELNVVDELDDVDRGGGFGSTGNG